MNHVNCTKCQFNLVLQDKAMGRSFHCPVCEATGCFRHLLLLSSN